MKVLILNGSKKHDSRVIDLITQIKTIFVDQKWEINEIRLNEINLAYCTGCFSCGIKTPGKCIISQDIVPISKKFMASDLAIYFSPITFGGYSSSLKKVLDRHIPLILPYFQEVNGEIHHEKRYAKKPCLLSIGFLENSDIPQEEIFRALLSRNAINMWAPFSQALVYTLNAQNSQFESLLSQTIQTVEELK